MNASGELPVRAPQYTVVVRPGGKGITFDWGQKRCKTPTFRVAFGSASLIPLLITRRFLVRMNAQPVGRTPTRGSAAFRS
jgi:hypothetical protein